MANQTLTIRRPDDWHVHLRDGEMLLKVAPYTANQFARAIASYRALAGDASAEVMRLVSRDLDKAYAHSRLPRAAE